MCSEFLFSHILQKLQQFCNKYENTYTLKKSQSIFMCNWTYATSSGQIKYTSWNVQILKFYQTTHNIKIFFKAFPKSPSVLHTS
jgi:hypothetical protein